MYYVKQLCKYLDKRRTIEGIDGNTKLGATLDEKYESTGESTVLENITSLKKKNTPKT